MLVRWHGKLYSQILGIPNTISMSMIFFFFFFNYQNKKICTQQLTTHCGNKAKCNMAYK